MNKKGLFGIPWYEMLSLVIFVIMLGAIFTAVSKYRSPLKKAGIDDEAVNGVDILVAQIEALRTKDGEKEFASKIDGTLQIDVYGKCKEEQTTKCSRRPRICVTNPAKRAESYCRDVEGTDLQSATISASGDIKMEKTEKDGEVVTRIYT